MHHELKILPVYFGAVQDGSKTFEIRYNRDRGFQKGDTLLLREFSPGVAAGSYTGRTIEKRITYVSTYEQKPDYAVLALADA